MSLWVSRAICGDCIIDIYGTNTCVAWGKQKMGVAAAMNDDSYDIVKDMPTHEDFMYLRGTPARYTNFLDRFVRQVVGARKFDKWAVGLRISAFVKISDEAFAMLVYENQEDRWKQMLKDKTTKSTIAAKWTDGGKPKGDTGRSRKAKGWDNSGILRFNKLCELVQADIYIF